MEGTIVNYRLSRHTQKGNHMIIIVNGADSKEKAASLIGKKVTWVNEKGNAISGKVAASHGNKGAVRVIFEKGMPGQALSSKVKIE
jgi:large subunit ribosomal protein L35Ae